ncbi:RNA-directed DNA polymerase [Sandaracinobacteroides saxicola]|uniref:RNA-directed DNA polymerase n=1 Tax=Sandaracinobacteroides saxicola TaxID=2759707 RepID=A0A7G5IKD9_9SPHN|nr:RNA-directed DNA polymerase [Sandaracinobacteroides saxicola]QMW23831.1 RNA-directed DNA polymerase [Sandaracinobacteroides saxicola]
MKDRWGLIQRGLFPETLPPCYTSIDLKRAFSGLVRTLKTKELHKGRQSDYVRYNGTKHDGSRRYFGTPNPISYFYVANFIANHWVEFEARFNSSPFSVSTPRIGKPTDDRPVIIPSLSELTTVASKKLGRSAFILKTDIAQFFPSIYTHAIAWSAHGVDIAKADTSPTSVTNYFNQLDFFVRNCQLAETRGVLVGPDAFRLVSEYIASGLDSEIFADTGGHIIGAARHVDDYYIGLGSEIAALATLSVLRDKLQRYSLHINDAKTKTMLSTEPLNDIWAQSLRRESREVGGYFRQTDDIILFLDRSLDLAKQLYTDSPIKIALRTMDKIKLYNLSDWEVVEPYLQRALFHHSHSIDYIALLVAKRVSIGKQIDREGWRAAAYDLIARHLPLNHHHEVVWLVWMLLVSRLALSDQLVDALSQNDNAHVQALVVAAYLDGLVDRRPPIRLGARLATTDNRWLLNLVARARGYSGAAFSGALAGEFQHIADKHVKLIDFKAHMKSVQLGNVQAISRTRYGYDNDDEEEDGDNWDDINEVF